MPAFNLEVSQKSAASPWWDWESLRKKVTLDITLRNGPSTFPWGKLGQGHGQMKVKIAFNLPTTLSCPLYIQPLPSSSSLWYTCTSCPRDICFCRETKHKFFHCKHLLTFLHFHCVQNTVMNLKLVFLGLWLPVLEASSGLVQWYLESSCRETPKGGSVRRSWEKPHLSPPLSHLLRSQVSVWAVLCHACARSQFFCLNLPLFRSCWPSGGLLGCHWPCPPPPPILCVLPVVHPSGDTALLAPEDFLCPSTGPFQKLWQVGNVPWNTWPCHLEASSDFLRVASPLVEVVCSRYPLCHSLCMATPWPFSMSP